MWRLVRSLVEPKNGDMDQEVAKRCTGKELQLLSGRGYRNLGCPLAKAKACVYVPLFYLGGGCWDVGAYGYSISQTRCTAQLGGRPLKQTHLSQSMIDDIFVLVRLSWYSCPVFCFNSVFVQSTKESLTA